MDRSRREFLADVGKGMLVRGCGARLASELGMDWALADSGSARLSFGQLEPLVDLLQETRVERLLHAVVDKIKSGTELGQLVGAGALANARTFGGEDYIGFHTFMALAPAYAMSKELPEDKRALPILKVLYRNSNQIRTRGGGANEVLQPLSPEGDTGVTAEGLRQLVRQPDVNAAERAFVSMIRKGPEQAFNDIQPMIEDDADVHRVVLAYRAWTLMGMTGKEHAHTMLRQTVRYCAKSEKGYLDRKGAPPAVREVLPRLLDKYKLVEKPLGNRKGDDAWVDAMAHSFLKCTPEQGAEAVASALADGYSVDSVGEALTMGANLQILMDPGRSTAYPGKPIGSVHGDSSGVHSSDSMNAWRNICKVANHPNIVASLVVSGSHLLRCGLGTPHWTYHLDDQLEAIKRVSPDSLLAEADTAIREQNQSRAAALVQRYGEQNLPERPVFNMLLKYATSEDRALHAEKYYRTVSEEFARTRPAYRWRQLVGLARVTASEYGKRADGYEEACRLLKV